MKKNPASAVYKIPALALFAVLAAPLDAQIAKVVNAASFVQNRSLTPGSIITIFGTKLAATTAFASPVSPPKTLGGVSVTVGGLPATLFYVSPTQVNAQIDPGVVAGPAVPLTLTSGTVTYTATLKIETVGAPGLFSLSGCGTRDGAVLNAVTFAPGPFSVTTGGAPTYLALYATGLSLTAPVQVTVNGVSVPVLWAGNAPGFAGLQQINTQLLESLAGAGRVEVAVTSGGKTSNVVEIVILPSPGQGPFAPGQEHQARHRELAGMAYVPGTSRVLLTDEDDDVIRVIDVAKRAVIGTIALPDGSEPVAIAVNPGGTLAVVAERDREVAAIIDIGAGKALSEAKVGGGPVSVGIWRDPASTQATPRDLAVVVNQDTDNVSILDLTTGKVIETLPVGRAPRYVSIDNVAHRAFVTNQGDGTVSVIGLAGTPVLSAAFNLGFDSRPQAIQVMPLLGVALITEPSAHSGGKVVLVNSATGQILSTAEANPDKTGGSGDIAVHGSTVYLTNQTGGSVTAAKVVMAGQPPAPVLEVSAIKVDIGARALAVDALDNVLAVSNQGSGTVVLIDLATNKVVARIDAVRGENESENDKHDNRDDHDRARNLPAITSISPKSAKPGHAFTLIISGENLTGASDVVFLDPSSVPGIAAGRDHPGGSHGHGPFKVSDQAIEVSNIVVKSSAQITATVAIGANALKGERIVRLSTPNGETGFLPGSNNTFKVE